MDVCDQDSSMSTSTQQDIPVPSIHQVIKKENVSLFSFTQWNAVNIDANRELENWNL